MLEKRPYNTTHMLDLTEGEPMHLMWIPGAPFPARNLSGASHGGITGKRKKLSLKGNAFHECWTKRKLMAQDLVGLTANAK